MKNLLFSVLIVALTTVPALAQKPGSIEPIKAELNYAALQPGDKALLDKALEIEAAPEGYFLGGEDLNTITDKSAWDGYTDRLQLMRWLSAVEIARRQLQITDAAQFYRVSNLVPERYAIVNKVPLVPGDYAFINLIVKYVNIPIDDPKEELHQTQFDLNAMSNNHVLAQRYGVLRYFASCEWQSLDRELLNQENQAWYELDLAFDNFFVGCVIQGSMGPMVLSGCQLELFDNRVELIETLQNIDDGLVTDDNANVFSFYTEESTDEEFFHSVNDYVDNDKEYMGYAENKQQREAAVKELLAAWHKWLDVRKRIYDTLPNETAKRLFIGDNMKLKDLLTRIADSAGFLDEHNDEPEPDDPGQG